MGEGLKRWEKKGAVEGRKFRKNLVEKLKLCRHNIEEGSETNNEKHNCLSGWNMFHFSHWRWDCRTQADKLCWTICTSCCLSHQEEEKVMKRWWQLRVISKYCSWMKMGIGLLSGSGQSCIWKGEEQHWGLAAEKQAVVSVVCTQRSQMQLIITKVCLFMESEVTTILESPNFCLNTSSMSHSFCSG